MSDSYLAISTLAADAAFRARAAACAATQEGVADPKQWVNANALFLAASPGFGAAWDSAVEGGVENPGADAAVITDAQILSAVQALLAD